MKVEKELKLLTNVALYDLCMLLSESLSVLATVEEKQIALTSEEREFSRVLAFLTSRVFLEFRERGKEHGVNFTL